MTAEPEVVTAPGPADGAGRNASTPRHPWHRVLIWAGVLVALFFLPDVMPSNYHRGILILSVVYAVYGIAFDVQLGYAGLFNLGHAMFFGFGAYTVGILSDHYDIHNVLITIPVATVVGTLAALAVGVVCLRRDGLQLAMISLGLSQIALLIVLNEQDITRGPRGISIPPPHAAIGPMQVDLANQKALYLVALLVLGLSILVVRRLLGTRMGSGWLCIRENPVLARSQGVRVMPAKYSATLIGGAMAGAAGALYAYAVAFLTPSVFSLTFIVTALVVVLIGGSGTTYGPVLGAVLYALVPEYLRVAADRRLLIFGGLLALVMLFMPEGLWPQVVRAARRLRTVVR